MPPAKKQKELEPVGVHFGKHDLERMGFFIEGSYLHGKGYVSPYKDSFNPNAGKGRQLLPGGPKSKNATQDGYFADTFMRVFAKEAYSNPFELALHNAVASKKKNVSARAFYPAGATKKHSCPGDYFGTFTGRIDEFSPVTRGKPKYVKEKPNCMTRPGKKGGPGYIDICLSKYPEHSSKDFYDESRNRQRQALVLHKRGMKDGPLLNAVYPQPYFDKNPFFTENPHPPYRAAKPTAGNKIIGAGKFLPAGPGKWPGGCKDGCFNKFPEYKNDQYKSLAEMMRGKYREKKIWYPGMGIKPMPTCSTVNHNIDFRVNAKNWTTFTPVVYPLTV